jgi:hypothetical protein
MWVIEGDEVSSAECSGGMQNWTFRRPDNTRLPDVFAALRWNDCWPALPNPSQTLIRKSF